MTTFYAYQINDLRADVGRIPPENFDLLTATQRASKDDLMAVLDEHCAAQVSASVDDDPIFSLCASMVEGGELDLWVFKMLRGTSNCIGVFPHAMAILADEEVWTYER